MTLYSSFAAIATMLPRILRLAALRSARPVNRRVWVQGRTLIAAPKPGDGPLMSRRADRELPGKLNTPLRQKATLIEIKIFQKMACAGCVPFPSSSQSSSPQPSPYSTTRSPHPPSSHPQCMHVAPLPKHANTLETRYILRTKCPGFGVR